jgi:hypothetical protein
LEAREDEAAEQAPGRCGITRRVQRRPVGFGLDSPGDRVLRGQQRELRDRDHEQGERDGGPAAEVGRIRDDGEDGKEQEREPGHAAQDVLVREMS